MITLADDVISSPLLPEWDEFSFWQDSGLATYHNLHPFYLSGPAQ